jgi:Short C-terminal domain
MRRRRGGLVGTMARTAVIAGTASAVAGGVHHRQAQRWEGQQAEQDAAAQQAADAQAYQQQLAQQQAQQAAAATAAAAAPPGTPDLTAQIQQLATLKQQGILTDEEFQAAKMKLISG